MMNTRQKNNKNILHHNKGVAAIEFALVLPLLIFLILAVVEVSRFISSHQRIDKVTAQMADIISQVKSPKTFDADGPVLRGTFEQLLGGTASTDSGFVYSVIERDADKDGVKDAPTITYQSSMNGVSSQIGSEGTDVSAADLQGLEVLPRDMIIVVESRIKHENLFGDLLSNFELSGGSGIKNFNGEELYKSAIYRYRSTEKEKIDASPQDIGSIPPVCGYYRDAEDNQTLPDPRDSVIKTTETNYDPTKDGDNKTWRFRDYNIYLPSADNPHPCECYSNKQSNIRSRLRNRLRTCVPELLAAPYTCPSRSNCCSTASNKTKTCNGCYDTQDSFVPATNTSDPICSPPPPPPCTGCGCPGYPTCPPPPPPPPCIGCSCTNSCPPTPCTGCSCTDSCPKPEIILGS